MKTHKHLLVMILFIITIPFTIMAQNYSDAMEKAIGFYDANRCGPDAASGSIFSDWRGACHTRDGEDVGVDLTGGYHDAGDHVKFGLPQGYTAAVLGWSLYEFKAQYDQAGVTNKFLSVLKYFTDYFLNSYSGGRFYYQVGEGEVDHTYWGPPEEQTENRPTYAWADSSNPASDVLGETSAALTLMYLNYRDVDSGYADRCLQLARTLYDMGRSTLGPSEGQSFYQSSSYYDDLSWAAVWLYVVDGEQSYITDINEYLSHPTQNGDKPLVQNHWTMCWDDMGLAVLTKLGILTGDSLYIGIVEENLDYWMNELTTSPGGMKYLHNWGVLRYNAAASMIALIYYGHTGNNAYYNFAEGQIDYILGDNPARMSFMIGYGSNWPTHPHHRGANGYTYANGDNQKEAQHTLTGALVGGPDQSDNYVDDVNQFQYTEVAIDYNAGLVGALAGIIKYNGNPPPPPTTTPPPATPPPTTPQPGILGDVNEDGSITIVDALVVAQYYVGLIGSNELNTGNADVDDDGQITIVDALMIAQYYVGLISEF